jgi:hypothetical protein
MKHRAFIGFIAAELLILLLFFAYGQTTLGLRDGELRAKRDIVKKLRLTDFALWTEARYTRNPSQTDLFSAFQDFPSSLEHFPAGSIVPPENVNETTEIRYREGSPGAFK